MSWFVYGFFPGVKGRTEPQMTALVSVHYTREHAEESRDVENQGWSDEGLIFKVTERQLVADSTYNELVERVSK